MASEKKADKGMAEKKAADKHTPDKGAAETELERDEQSMDDAAQAGVGGAFGAAKDAKRVREEMLRDAERTFGEQERRTDR